MDNGCTREALAVRKSQGVRLGRSPLPANVRSQSEHEAHGSLLFLAVLPFILGTLSLLVPGETGLGTANPRGPDADEAAQLVMLNISAVFMGSALSIRDLVGERAIFQREQAAGLSATAYLLAKIGVYG